MSQSHTAQAREPLVHLSKRSAIHPLKAWGVRLIALILGLIVCGLVVLINPWWSEPTKLFDVIGVMLLFSSVVSIVRLVLVWPIKGE